MGIGIEREHHTNAIKKKRKGREAQAIFVFFFLTSIYAFPYQLSNANAFKVRVVVKLQA